MRPVLSFILILYPTSKYVDKIGNMVVEFSMDTFKDKSEWIIASLLELKSQNYGKTIRDSQSRKIKRYWLYQVVRWRCELESGSTQEEIHLSKCMLCRKLRLLERLSPEIIEHILKLKYERDRKNMVLGNWNGFSLTFNTCNILSHMKLYTFHSLR